METHPENEQSRADAIELPAPTVWPMVLALGVSLIIGGMVTSVAISLLGLLLTGVAGVGWFRQVLPVASRIRGGRYPGNASCRRGWSHCALVYQPDASKNVAG